MGFPPQGVYTQADADRDIAVHAALTTGIHGVGSLYVAGFGVAGQELSKVIWKDASATVLSLSNKTANIDWTTKDLTTWVSNNAKFAILRLRLKADTVGSGNYSQVRVRKNGTTPTHMPNLVLDKAGTTAAVYQYQTVIVALDNDRVCEYSLDVGTGWQVDLYIEILGYIE